MKENDQKDCQPFDPPSSQHTLIIAVVVNCFECIRDENDSFPFSFEHDTSHEQTIEVCVSSFSKITTRRHESDSDQTGRLSLCYHDDDAFCMRSPNHNQLQLNSLDVCHREYFFFSSRVEGGAESATDLKSSRFFALNQRQQKREEGCEKVCTLFLDFKPRG